MISRGRIPRIVPCFGSAEFMICLWLACALLTLTLAASQQYAPYPITVPSRYGKRDTPRAGSFFIPSRYGRNDVPPKIIRYFEKSEMVPRAEQFVTARWGKRSRFNAVLDYIDRANRIDDIRNDELRTNANVFGISS